jgi:hypothetical protein
MHIRASLTRALELELQFFILQADFDVLSIGTATAILDALKYNTCGQQRYLRRCKIEQAHI